MTSYGWKLRSLARSRWLAALVVLPGLIASPSRASDASAVLGPLADQVSPGQSGAWTVGESDRGLLLSNPATPGAVRYYSTGWQGDLAAGRSVGVKVTAKGKGPLSGAGIVMLVSDGDPRWVAWVVTPDGRIAGYTRRPSELKQFSSTAIPGGSRPEGDLLQVSQKGDTAQILVNGRFVAEMKPAQGMVPTDPLPVGILALGTGDFTFDRFAFGPLVVPAKAGNDDTVPVARTGDDDVPVPGPPRSEAPKPVPNPPKPDSAPKVATVDVPSLGPLGKGVRLGPMDDWMRSVEDGRLVYFHDKDSDRASWRTIPWAGTTVEGRSAAVSVEVHGMQQAEAGLAFGFRNGGEQMLALLAGVDDKIRLYSVKGKTSDLVESFDPPQRDDPNGPHRLKVSQTGDTTTLYADGKLLKTLGKGALDASGNVGILVRGVGRFAFRDFAFGPADAPPSPPPPGPPAPPRVRTALKSFSPDTFGALFGVMAHEFGHFMVGELQIPSTGPEEDVADEFAAMVFIDNFKDNPQLTMAMATGMAKLWWFMAEEKGGDATPFYDEHAPNRTRFAKFLCMLYGASPENFGQLMDAAGIPDRTKQRCQADEPRRHAAWDTLLKPLRRRGVAPNIPGVLDPATPGHKIEVVYEETKNPAMRPFAEEIRDSGVFDAIADGITKLYVLPRDTKLVFRDCDKTNCFYLPDDGSVTVCWEMIGFVLDQYRKQGQGTDPAPTPVTTGGEPLKTGRSQSSGSSMTPEQFLIGRWRSRTAADGVTEDALIELNPQGAYRSQVQAQTQQGVTMLNVQGRWSVQPVNGTSLQLTFSPQQWYPTQFCRQGYCQSIPMTTERYRLEIVDKNTVRSDRGVATRVQ